MSILDTAIDLSSIDPSQYKKYIGKGYRSVFYTTDVERNGRCILFGYDVNGNEETFIIPHKSWIKYKVKYPTEEKDSFGNFVETKYFKNVYDRRKYLDNANGLAIVEALKPEQECLHSLFDDCVLDADFNNQTSRMFFLDIETEIHDSFMSPKDALDRINMMTIYDTKTEMYYTWSLKDAQIDFKEDPLNKMDKSKFKLFSFNDNEEDLLNHFIKFWSDNYPSVVIGYNSQAYDIPYIFRRIEIVLGNSAAEKLSPVGKYRIKEVNHDNARANEEAEIEVDIQGIFHADELILYRDKFGVKPALDGGYSLNNVGEAEELGHKIHYDGTLKDLYEKDYQKFYEYNVRDVDLLKRIEDKCRLVPLAKRVAGAGLCNYDAIYSSISYLIGSLISFAKSQMGGIIFQSYLAKKKENQTFEGAFVFPPTTGLYKGGIATVDFNSLYPSTIRSLNISPETYVGKLIPLNVANPDDPIDLDETTVQKFYLKPSNGGKMKEITKDQVLELCKTKCIFTRNNTLFLKHSVKQGIISAWCKKFYALRKSTKKAMQKLDLKVYNKEITGEENIRKAKFEIQNLDNVQHSIKIMLNSVYGILGTAHSAIGNPDLAQTITRNGKFCNISASKFIKDWFIEKFKVDDSYVSTVSGDTDSQFVNIKCITDHFKKKYGLPEKINSWSDEYKLKLWDFVDNFVEKKINPFVQNLISTKCFSEHPEVLQYSLEYIGDCGIYEQKKHYAVHKIVSEGPEIVNKLKFTGIELKKASVPKEIKVFLKDIYENTLINDWDENDYRNYINEAYDKFCKMDINEISIWKGWSSDKIESEGFLKCGKGTTGISKACHYFNDMINHLKLGKKYNSLRTGNKYRFSYINTNNPYGINCIAFEDGNWPKEFNGIFSVDYEVMFQKLILQPLAGYLAATKFSNVDPRQRVVQDIFAL